MAWLVTLSGSRDGHTKLVTDYSCAHWRKSPGEGKSVSLSCAFNYYPILLRLCKKEVVILTPKFRGKNLFVQRVLIDKDSSRPPDIVRARRFLRMTSFLGFLHSPQMQDLAPVFRIKYPTLLNISMSQGSPSHVACAGRLAPAGFRC